MEESYKPSIEHQRWLNLTMKEVMRAEALKLLNAGIIYAISNSSWVSPVQVVPKQGGVTVVKNEKNKLLPTRSITGWRVCSGASSRPKKGENFQGNLLFKLDP